MYMFAIKTKTYVKSSETLNLKKTINANLRINNLCGTLPVCMSF
jgi:hypothetical protein